MSDITDKNTEIVSEEVKKEEIPIKRKQGRPRKDTSNLSEKKRKQLENARERARESYQRRRKNQLKNESANIVSDLLDKLIPKDKKKTNTKKTLSHDTDSDEENMPKKGTKSKDNTTMYLTIAGIGAAIYFMMNRKGTGNVPPPPPPSTDVYTQTTPNVSAKEQSFGGGNYDSYGQVDF